jgi:hypothetical protein
MHAFHASIEARASKAGAVVIAQSKAREELEARRMAQAEAQKEAEATAKAAREKVRRQGVRGWVGWGCCEAGQGLTSVYVWEGAVPSRAAVANELCSRHW